MRPHSTSIIGPDLDGPEMRECKCVDGPGPCGRFIKHTVRNDRQIEVCCGCGAETDVGPAWTGCIKASDLEPPTPPVVVEAPAQPSVGERLGAVARDEWLATGAVARWDRIALAVRREVLKEVFAEEDVEAAAKAMWNATRPGITWDELREASREPVRVQARAALAAADSASGERVVYTASESTLFAKVFRGAPAGSSFFVQPGEELVVRKGRG